MGVFGKRLQLGGCAERSGPLFRLVSRLDLLEKAEAEVDAVAVGGMGGEAVADVPTGAIPNVGE